MPICSSLISRIMIEKAAKDGRKLQKVSTRVQMWTRLQKPNLANFIARAGQGEARSTPFTVARSFFSACFA